MKQHILALIAALGLSTITGGMAQAATLSDVDLTTLSFTRPVFQNNSGRNDFASGLSNGIGYEFHGGVFGPFSNLTRFNDLAPGNDRFLDLHVGSDFAIRFDQPISSLLVAMGNDNRPGETGINFGYTASDSIDTVGTAPNYLVQDIRGALVLFEFDTPVSELTQQIAPGSDGFDLVFFANPLPVPVPLPAGMPLLLSAFAAMGALGWKRRARRS